MTGPAASDPAMPPALHRHRPQGQPVESVARAHDVVGVGLPHREHEGKRAAESSHQQDDHPDVIQPVEQQQGHHQRDRGRAHRADAQQRPALPPVGDGPGQQAQQEEGQHPGRRAHAHHQLRAGQLEDEPAHRHLLHPRSQRVQHRRGPQQPKVPDAQRNGPIPHSVHAA